MSLTVPRTRLSWQISWHGQTRFTKPQNLCFCQENHLKQRFCDFAVLQTLRYPQRTGTIDLDRQSLDCPKPQTSLQTVRMRTIPFWYWVDRRVIVLSISNIWRLSESNIQYLEAFGNQYPISRRLRKPISNASCDDTSARLTICSCQCYSY